MTDLEFIPQFIPYWGDKERESVLKILDSDYLNEHKTVREFEKRFSEFVGARFCVTVTSGTTALYLALKSIYQKHKPHKIQVPDYAGIFVANACTQADINPILTDVNNNGSLSKNDGEYFVVHSNGRLGSVQMLEDCAQAISYHTKNCVSCYSFASTKHLTTAGQGGAICCDDEEIFDKLTRLKDLGRNDRQNLKPMSDNFEFWGINSKFTEMQAAFGLVQLEKLPRRLDRLKKMYRIYNDELKNCKGVEFFDEEPKWYIDILVKDPQTMITILKKHNIQARRFYKPLHMQPLYNITIHTDEFKNSIDLYNKGLWLPSTTNLTDEQILYVCKTIKESIDK
jgi:dTDP-4-amino-4,6-dideoxygalactose transaminase